MFYVYEDHLSGRAYLTSIEYECGELFCEQCGDSDKLLEEFETEEQAEKYANKYNQIDDKIK